ncbi:hypothetical protein [Bifidobacterium samirii]|nr:hypothetical protein [Bifidobacterium samirii]
MRMVTRAANGDGVLSDGISNAQSARHLASDVRGDMLIAEAQEYGIVDDDATEASTIPNDVLIELGLTPGEVEARVNPH